MLKNVFVALAVLGAQGCAVFEVLDELGLPAAETGAGVPAAGASASTPLHDAALAGNLRQVKRLVAAGADVNARNEQNWTPVDAALLMDHNDVAQYLMENGGKSNPQAADADGDTWLIGAAAADDKELAVALLEQGADPNHRNNLGRTALMYAAIEGQDDIAKALLQKNADPNIGDNDGDTALHLAIYMKAKGLNIVRLLLASKANPNAANELGDTPMHWAAAAGNIEAARLLISSGAGVNARSKAGQSPLGRAMGKQQSAFAAFLRAQGATD